MPAGFMIPQDYFASKRRKCEEEEDAEIPSIRGGAGRDRGGPAAATGANAAALPKRLKTESTTA